MNKLLGKPLTPRELQVCNALVSFPDKDAVIAFKLKLNFKTFGAHQHNLYKKLGVGSRVELILQLLGKPRVQAVYIDENVLLRHISKKLDLLLEYYERLHKVT